MRFHVQLKATDQPDLSRSLGVQIRRDTADFYRRLALPLLMVRYRGADRTLYVRWFHQFDLAEEGLTQTVSFCWDRTDRLGADDPGRLAEEARAFLTLRSPELTLPLDMYLDVEPGGAYGLEPAVLRMALRSAAEARRDVLRVRAGQSPAGAARIVAADTVLSVVLAKVTVATIRLDHYQAGDVGEQFATDALVVAALAFEYLGRTDIATRLTTGFLLQSSIAVVPEVGWALSLAFRRSRRLQEALDLASALHDSDDPARREASLPFLLAAMWRRRSLSATELSALDTEIGHRIARDLDNGRSVEAGRGSYTLANLLRSCGDPADSLAAYDRALLHDPGYALRAYFHEERAGALFLTGRFEEAADGYQEAGRLGSSHRVEALRADSLMFAGRYAEAKAAFEQYLALPADDDASEWQLKRLFLSTVIEGFGIAGQNRDSQRAVELLSRHDFERTPADEILRTLEAVVRVDALQGLVWFNFGRAYLDVDDRASALVSYLGAALCARGDAEAWVNVVVLAMGSADTAHLAEAALRCGARSAGTEFRRHLVIWTRAQDSGFPTEEMLALIDEHLEEIDRHQDDAMLLRLIGPDGVTTEVVIGPDNDTTTDAA